MLFEKNDKGEQSDAADRQREPDMAQVRLLMAQEQRPVSHHREGEERKFCQLWRQRMPTSWDSRHKLRVAQRAPPGDAHPQKGQQRREEEDVGKGASSVGAARNREKYGFRGEH